MTLEIATVPATVCVAFVAVIDPSITTIAIAALSAVVALATLYAKYRSDALAKELVEAKQQLAAQAVKVEDVAKLVNGVTAKLVQVTGDAKLAEGKAAGVAQATSDAAKITAATAAGVAQEQEAEKNRKMTPSGVTVNLPPGSAGSV